MKKFLKGMEGSAGYPSLPKSAPGHVPAHSTKLFLLALLQDQLNV